MTKVRAIIAAAGIGFLAAGGTMYRFWAVPRTAGPSADVAHVVEGSPRSVVYDLLKGLLDGDGRLIRQAVYARDADEMQAVDVLTEYATAARRLARAGEAAFGPEKLRPVGLPAAQQLEVQVVHLNEVVDGDLADVDFHPTANPSVFHLRRMDGCWRIMVRETFDPGRAEDRGPMVGMMQAFRAQAKAFAVVASEIEGGKFPTLAEAQLAMNIRMSESLREGWRGDPPPKTPAPATVPMTGVP